MNDKEQMQKEIEKFKRSRLIFLIIALCLLGAAVILFIVAAAIGSASGDLAFTYDIGYFAGVLLSASIVMFILRSALFNTRISNRQNIINGDNDNVQAGDTYENSNVVNTYSQNDLKKNIVSTPIDNRDIELLKQYKTLLDQGIITQEDYDKKKKELLG